MAAAVTAPTVQETLWAVGLGLVGDERVDVQRETAREARFLRELAVRTVGLAPAGFDVPVAAAALELGRALAAPGTGAVGVLDALGTWPCAGALRAREAPSTHGVCVSWLRDRLAVLTPRPFDGASQLDRYREAIRQVLDSFEHVVVDLTGFHRGAELTAALEVLDGCVLVARSGRSKVRQLRRVYRAFPEETSLGILLTGA